MNLGIIGVGLIGGSIALDLKKSGLASRVLGADQLEETGEEAVRLGLIDECVTVDRLAVESDLIVAAIPVTAMLTYHLVERPARKALRRLADRNGSGQAATKAHTRLA